MGIIKSGVSSGMLSIKEVCTIANVPITSPIRQYTKVIGNRNNPLNINVFFTVQGPEQKKGVEPGFGRSHNKRRKGKSHQSTSAKTKLITLFQPQGREIDRL